MIDPEFSPRRRSRWPLYAVPAAVLLLAAGWSVFWFVAASRISTELDGWRDREARSGRVYDCAQRTVGGFPFRLEVHCNGAGVSLVSQTAEQTATRIPVTARLADIHVVTQIYDPTLIIAEFTGPVTFTDIGQQPSAVANWTLGQASVAGLPTAPQRAVARVRPRVHRPVERGGAVTAAARRPPRTARAPRRRFGAG